MPNLFSVDDPNGVPVHCDKKWWAEHIEGRHPELSGHHEDVARAIAKPLGVYRSKTHASRRIFYAPSTALPPPFDRGLIRVVVEFRRRALRGDRGQVITAMHTLRPAEGEILVWPRDED